LMKLPYNKSLENFDLYSKEIKVSSQDNRNIKVIGNGERS